MHPKHPMQPYINLYIFLIWVYASMHLCIYACPVNHPSLQQFLGMINFYWSCNSSGSSTQRTSSVSSPRFVSAPGSPTLGQVQFSTFSAWFFKVFLFLEEAHPGAATQPTSASSMRFTRRLEAGQPSTASSPRRPHRWCWGGPLRRS